MIPAWDVPDAKYAKHFVASNSNAGRRKNLIIHPNTDNTEDVLADVTEFKTPHMVSESPLSH